MSDYKMRPAKCVDLGAVVAEAQKYETERDRAELCGRTSVQAVNCLVLNDILHAGVVSHVCRLKSGHAGECECCGYSWIGGGK